MSSAPQLCMLLFYDSVIIFISNGWSDFQCIISESPKLQIENSFAYWFRIIRSSLDAIYVNL